MGKRTMLGNITQCNTEVSKLCLTLSQYGGIEVLLSWAAPQKNVLLDLPENW